MTNRLDLLKQAAWKAKQKRLQKACRICGGCVNKSGVYCNRHWNYMRGADPEMMQAASRGENLEECDAWVKFRQQGHYLKWTSDHTIWVSKFETLRISSHEWVLRRNVQGTEIEEGRFKTVEKAIEYLNRRRHDFSAHNRYATKVLIR